MKRDYFTDVLRILTLAALVVVAFYLHKINEEVDSLHRRLSLPGLPIQVEVDSGIPVNVEVQNEPLQVEINR